jgi:hypothetical protein
VQDTVVFRLPRRRPQQHDRAGKNSGNANAQNPVTREEGIFGGAGQNRKRTWLDALPPKLIDRINCSQFRPMLKSPCNPMPLSLR